MDEYRALHHARYMQREQQRMEEEFKRVRLEEEQRIEQERKEQRADAIMTQFTNLITDIHLMVSIIDISGIVISILGLLESEYDFLLSMSKQEKLTEMGATMLEAINTNSYARVNFHNQEEVAVSYTMQNNVKKILSMCNVIQENELDIMYDMDTSNDELMALQLQEQLQNSRILDDRDVAQRLSQEMNNPPAPQRRTRRTASDAPQVPRPRGRPRRGVV